MYAMNPLNLPRKYSMRYVSTAGKHVRPPRLTVFWRYAYAKMGTYQKRSPKMKSKAHPSAPRDIHPADRPKTGSAGGAPQHEETPRRGEESRTAKRRRRGRPRGAGEEDPRGDGKRLFDPVVEVEGANTEYACNPDAPEGVVEERIDGLHGLPFSRSGYNGMRSCRRSKQPPRARLKNKAFQQVCSDPRLQPLHNTKPLK